MAYSPWLIWPLSSHLSTCCACQNEYSEGHWIWSFVPWSTTFWMCLTCLTMRRLNILKEKARCENLTLLTEIVRAGMVKDVLTS
jgi:hypothetical protein